MPPGRNDPCPCGSGRKYKHCCGRSDDVGACNAQAALLQREGRYDEAVASYRKALALAPNLAELHFNLGTALHDQGRVDDAIACYRRALTLKPDLVVAYNNLGNALAVCGKPEEAAASYARALEVAPHFTEARRNLAHAQAHHASTLHAQGRLEDAMAAYRAALTVQPEDPRLHNNLGNVQLELGDVDAALASYRRALELGDTPEVRSNLARCLRHARAFDATTRALLVRALREAWTRPADFAPAAIAALDVEAEGLLDDPLLLALLETTAACDVDLEARLAAARRALLAAAVRDSDTVTPFQYALARQCFINEHVYAVGDDERAQATTLRAALANGEPLCAAQVLAVAAYFRLVDVANADALLQRAWPDPVRAVLTEQIAEPLEERRDAAAIPALTPVSDAVSTAVQRQYEENPYPRWIRPATVVPAPSLAALLRRQFPFAAFDPVRSDGAPEVLVAGCGTGQEPIELAQQWPNARVLAVDLSRASLAYARRRSRAAGVTNVEYAQADVLHIASIERTFDVVSCVGVLHHLADPAGGLRALVAVLRPGGMMRIGLYSERARRDVVEARDFIAARGYAPDLEGIRRCRAALAAERTRFGRVLARRDFYTTSECRDLLFHVQEHRFTIPRIGALLAAHGLRFIGFLLEPQIAHGYATRFPDDAARNNLELWDAFETEFPDTFAGMYRFWVQRPA